MSVRTRQLAVVAGGALLLTACGGHPLDDRTGSQVVAAAADALEEAGAVHVAGTVDEDGDQGAIDLQLQGEDTLGTLTFGGAEVQLLTVGGKSYLQGAPEFWASLGLPAEASANFEGQWVVIPDEQATTFEQFSLAGFVDQLRDPGSTPKKDVRADEVDGDPVVVVEQEDGTTLTVANAERAYPLTVEDTGDTPSKLVFSAFGEKDDISVPPDALDLSEVLGR
jgi:hypothetical protein